MPRLSDFVTSPAVVGAVTSLLGAVLGAWWGARAAVVRLRSERAFERQLQWHEEIADNLNRLAPAINQYVAFSRMTGPGGSEHELAIEAYDRVNAEIDRLSILALKAELYASAESFRDVRRLIVAVQAAMAAAGLNPTGDRRLQEQQLAAMGTLIGPIRGAARSIAGDVRRQLGLKPAPDLTDESTRSPDQQGGSRSVAQ